MRASWPELTPDEFLVLARTVYGEARGEDAKGQRAVAHVMLNRWKARPKYGADLAGVCLKPWQFSCWNEKDPNRPRLLRITIGNSRVLRSCMLSALQAFDEYDLTQGSMHYHTKNIKQVPKWAFGHRPIYTHLNHVFYNDIQ